MCSVLLEEMVKLWIFAALLFGNLVITDLIHYGPRSWITCLDAVIGAIGLMAFYPR